MIATYWSGVVSRLIWAANGRTPVGSDTVSNVRVQYETLRTHTTAVAASPADQDRPRAAGDRIAASAANPTPTRAATEADHGGRVVVVDVVQVEEHETGPRA